MRKLNNIIAGRLFLPLSDLFTNNKIYSFLQFLNKSQYWTREQIENYQNLRLQKLIWHAYKNVPFYRNLFNDLQLKPEDIRTKVDLLKLPVITKDELRRNKKDWIAKNIRKGDLIHANSSGSTGEPFEYYTTKQAESFRKATAIRSWQWMGYSLGDKYVKTSIRSRASLMKQIQDRMNSSLFLSFQQFEPEYFHDMIRRIEEYDPLYLRGYPVPLMFLAKQYEAENRIYKGKSLKAINTTGSTLHENERAFIEKYFNARIFDSYSCEGGTNFSQCSEEKWYHPSEEYAISEFIFDDFSKFDPAHSQRHITTDLHNYACPFIRYDTQDYVVKGPDESCSCGRKYINISKIKGRDTDILITPSGKYVLMENILGYFEEDFKISNVVKQIQVIQETKEKFVFNMIVNNNFTEEIKSGVFSYWQKFLGPGVNLEIRIVDEIQLTSTGKRRSVIRNSDIKLI